MIETKRTDSQRKQKILIFLKLVVFNGFFIGFVVNLIAYLNANWVESETYFFGFFEYCKKFKKFKSTNYLLFRKSDNRLFHRSVKELECANWIFDTQPKFVKRSFYCMSIALVSHISTVAFIIIFTLITNKPNLIDNNSKIETVIKFFKKHNILELFGSIVGFSQVICYGATLMSFLINQMFNKFESKVVENFGWCFWLSTFGFLLTVIPVFTLSINTYYFKFKKISSGETIRSSLKSDSLSYESFSGMFNIRSSELNKIFYNSNPNMSLSSLNTATNSSYVYSSPSEKTQDKNQRRKSIKRSSPESTTTTSSSFKGVMRSSLRSTKRSRAVKIDKPNKKRIKSNKNLKTVVNHEMLKRSLHSNSSTSNNIYSQVYPNQQKSFDFHHSKMVALPFGSLSGKFL